MLNLLYRNPRTGYHTSRIKGKTKRHASPPLFRPLIHPKSAVSLIIIPDVTKSCCQKQNMAKQVKQFPLQPDFPKIQKDISHIQHSAQCLQRHGAPAGTPDSGNPRLILYTLHPARGHKIYCRTGKQISQRRIQNVREESWFTIPAATWIPKRKTAAARFTMPVFFLQPFHSSSFPSKGST